MKCKQLILSFGHLIPNKQQILNCKIFRFVGVFFVDDEMRIYRHLTRLSSTFYSIFEKAAKIDINSAIADD
jgi:hypothetical protein